MPGGINNGKWYETIRAGQQKMDFDFKKVLSRFTAYWRLIRMDQPIGSFLLLWPTLNALWIASDGRPPRLLVAIFISGVVLMRSAGCAFNDYADREFDRQVTRTRDRPLACAQIASSEALIVAATLAIFAFLLILPLNRLAQTLSFVAVFIAASYPFTKRLFPIPQAYLGVAFGFGIPMAFAAVQNQVPLVAWVMLIANVFWSIAYDTEYAMVDREDDLKIGIFTSAITFGRYDVLTVMICYAVFFAIYAAIGAVRHYTLPFWLSLASVLPCIAYQYQLIRRRNPMQCFAAFKHNHWLGSLLFLGIAGHYAWINFAR